MKIEITHNGVVTILDCVKQSDGTFLSESYDKTIHPNDDIQERIILD